MFKKENRSKLLDFEITNEKLRKIKAAKIALKAKLDCSIGSIAKEERLSVEEVERCLKEDFGFVIENGRAYYPKSNEEFDRKLMELID
jgi:hypothetical protein